MSIECEDLQGERHWSRLEDLPVQHCAENDNLLRLKLVSPSRTSSPVLPAVAIDLMNVVGGEELTKGGKTPPPLCDEQPWLSNIHRRVPRLSPSKSCRSGHSNGAIREQMDR